MSQQDPHRQDLDAVMHHEILLNSVLPQTLYPGIVVDSSGMAKQIRHGIDMDEYANVMGVEVASLSEQQTADPFNAMHDNMTKMQANQTLFDNYVRHHNAMLGQRDENISPSNQLNVTSMTLPAGIGNGFVGFNLQASAGISERPLFGEASDVYTRSIAFPGSLDVPYETQAHASSIGVGRSNLTSQTLPPEMFSMRMKDDPHVFGSIVGDDELELMREAKSRERNRDHSRKSRLRKKEFVESLKQDAAQLQLYRDICENSADLLALVTSEPSAVLLYLSSSYSRELGYERDQLEPGETSFLDFVHPEDVPHVRIALMKVSEDRKSRKFRVRIKSSRGEYAAAETAASMSSKGIICSTRLVEEEWQ